uniref:Protein RRP5 homolog n=1 Tax=Poecilia latipinna TaxID=48699 RepID=A0A3B3VN23_9TELE
MASVEEDFPRGGKTKKSTDSKVTVERTKVDNLFQVKKKKKTSLSPRCSNKLLYNPVSDQKKGMLLLGCVKEVADFEVTVSLPCGLQGFLSIRNVCEAYTKLLSEQLDSDFCSLSQIFWPGMLLRCVVSKMDITKGGSLSIQLSVNPKLVNKSLTSSSLTPGMVLSGCVESVEDHGTIIDIGVSGTKAFLPEDATQSKQHKKLKVGQYVTSRVEEVKNDGRVVRLSAAARASANAKQGWTLTNLLPGLTVKATIKKVTKHGLHLDFLNSFSGQVDFLNMYLSIHPFIYFSTVQACVLYIEPTARLVGLSLRSHLLQPVSDINAAPPGGDRTGEVVNECKVTTMHHMSGAMLEDPGVIFYHPSDPANDNKVSAMPKHTCRILDFSPVEQIYFASLRKSVIDQRFYRYQDIHAGQVVEGTVSVLLSHGMVLHLSEHVKGLVPRTHLSDIILKNPEKKYIEGMKVKCRVLSVDVDNRKLCLTRKKALVESTLPLFLSYDDARPGRVSHGFIVSIKDFGCIIRFYGNVKGLVPLEELSSEPIVRPEDVFYIGQVRHKRVSWVVLVCLASVKLSSFPGYILFALQRVEARVVKKSVNGLEVVILPDEGRAVLPTVHLSDHMSNCQLLWEVLQEGDTVSDLISAPLLKTLTKKPRVRSSLEEGAVAKDFSEVTVGMQLVGCIRSIMSYGVFVEFPYGLVGLAPKSAMSDKFISDTTTAFEPGQTVIAKVTNVDEEKRRFLVTLKTSEVITSDGDARAALLNGVQERRAVKEMLTIRGALTLAALTVGQKLKLTVDSATQDGAKFKSDNLPGADVVASKRHVAGVSLTPGQKVNAVVLNVDILSTCVHVSVLPKLLGKKKSLNKGSDCCAVVQFVDRDFAVVSLNDAAQLTLLQTCGHPNEVTLSGADRLKAGMTLTVEVVEPSCEQLEGLPLVLWKGSAPKRQRRASENQADSSGHRFGEVLQGKVRSVKPTYIQVALEDGSTGSVHVSQVVEPAAVKLGSFPTSTVRVGSTVKARVIGGREATSHRFLPFSHPKFKYTIPELTLIPSHPEKLFKLGQAVRAKVVEASVQPHRFVLSLSGIHKLEKGSITLGMVTSVHPQVGLVVKLPFGGAGAVSITDVADTYRKNPLEAFSKDQLVRLLRGLQNVRLIAARLFRLNPQNTKPAKDPEVLSLDHLRLHQVVRGYVKSVSEQGIFIRLSHNITGRAQLQQSSKYFINNHKILSSHLPVNTLLTTKILSVDREDELVDLSLLPADTGKPDLLPESLGLPLRLVGDAEKRDSKKAKKRSHCESEQVMIILSPAKTKKSSKSKTDADDSGVEVYFREEEDEGEENITDVFLPLQVPPSSAGPSRLQVATGFSWDVGLSSLKPVLEAKDGDSSDGEEQDGNEKPQKKTRHELEQEKKSAEKALLQREAELMDPSLRPQDAAAFERLLLASPNSSLLWLQYMAHHLQATQIEQARAVAERALKTISFREEQEKLNVWVALLNLENMYGTQESLKKVFERAVQFCEPMPVYQQLADIYANSNKIKEAESLYKTMVKRFRQNKAVWLSYGTFLLQQGQSDAASSLLQRALKSLPPKESVDVITKFAQMEFRFGDAERGRNMFDKVLTSYPKRTDLWSVFIDLMVKHGSQKEVRAVFDRTIHLSVSVKKIKFFFKRYLEYEKKHGTPQSVQAVKEKAMEFVEAKGKDAAN